MGTCGASPAEVFLGQEVDGWRGGGSSPNDIGPAPPFRRAGPCRWNGRTMTHKVWPPKNYYGIGQRSNLFRDQPGHR
jgi:hypothetical protein